MPDVVIAPLHTCDASQSLEPQARVRCAAPIPHRDPAIAALAGGCQHHRATNFRVLGRVASPDTRSISWRANCSRVTGSSGVGIAPIAGAGGASMAASCVVPAAAISRESNYRELAGIAGYGFF